MVNVNRNTVNFYFSLFRLLIYHKKTLIVKKIIKGTLEINESYLGGKIKRGYSVKSGRGADKQPVFGIYEREKRFTRKLCLIVKRRYYKR